MADTLRCYRCGASLASLTPPLSRQDQCPECSVYLHVCRMCRLYDASVPRQCREDDAEDVTDKEKLNVCDWFEPSPDAFDDSRKRAADRAKSELDALFGKGGGPGESDDDDTLKAAEDLFK